MAILQNTFELFSSPVIFILAVVLGTTLCGKMVKPMENPQYGGYFL